MAQTLQLTLLFALLTICLRGGSADWTSGESHMRFRRSAESAKLDLSNHELYTLISALLEGSTTSCRSMNLAAMTSLKTFLLDSILVSAPEHHSVNPNFNQNYWKLMGCIQNYKDSNSKSDHSTKTLGSWEITRTRRDVLHAETTSEEENEENNLLAKEDPHLEHTLDIIELNKSFEYFFALLYSITENSCSKEKGSAPASQFMLNAIAQTLHWISTDSSLFKSAQIKYFHRTGIIEELEKCERKVELARTKGSHATSKTHVA